jgi:hypothetical protein
MKIGDLLPFAVHGISSLFLTHSMQLAGLGITLNQLTLLFQTLHTTVALQPVALHLCSEFLCLAIETASTELALDKPLTAIVVLLLKTVELTPISYWRQAYFECCSAVFTFCHTLRDHVSLKFPSFAGVRESIQLTACRAFTDYLNFETMPIDDSLIPQLLVLLQKTSDERVATLMVALASACNCERIPFWVAIVRRVLLANALLEEHDIEPNASVKECCLAISSAVLPQLAQSPLAETDDLDDIVSAAARAAETHRSRLQQAAFPVLQLVIRLFEGRTADGDRSLLALYDTHFLQAVRIGFKQSLSISGDFLATYLAYLHGRETRSADYAVVIKAYIDGMIACKQRSATYYSLATSLCQIVRRSPTDETSRFLSGILPVSEEVALKAMRLWKNRGDWRTLSEFRDLASSFYADLLPSLVWLETLTDSQIDVKSLCAFLVLDAQHGTEPWIAAAAYEAIPVMLQYFGDRLDADLVELALRLSVTKQGKPFDSVLLYTAALVREDQAYDRLRRLILSIVLDSNFEPAVVARVLQTDASRALTPYAPAVVQRTLREFASQRLAAATAVALLAVAIAHSPATVGYAIDLLLPMDAAHRDFVFTVLRVALPAARTGLPLVPLARFCVEHFKRGGMLLVGALLLSNAELAFALLGRGVAKAAFLLCANDLPNARAYLRFVQLALEAAEGFAVRGPFALAVLRLAFAVIRAFGSDPQIGHQILSLCVQIIWAAKRAVGEDAFKREFLRSEGREAVIAMMRLQIGKAAIRQRNANLVAFSANARARRAEDDWEDLEVLDGD